MAWIPVTCIVILYSDQEHPAPWDREVLPDGSGIQPRHAEKLRLQLFALDNAKRATDMNAPGWRLHRLAGELRDHWAISVSGNWWLTFEFEGEDVVLVDYQDYH